MACTVLRAFGLLRPGALPLEMAPSWAREIEISRNLGDPGHFDARVTMERGERTRAPAGETADAGCLAERAVVAALHQGNPSGWVVADRDDLLLSPCYGRTPDLTPA